VLAPAVAFAATLALGTPSVAPLARLATGALRPWQPDLALHLEDSGLQGEGALALDGAAGRRPGTAAVGPICSGDVCQPTVSVPGFEPGYSPAQRSEAVVALLARAPVEPLATVAWALMATGVRLDYAPPWLDGTAGNAHGWGSLTFRVRLRIDALNRPTIPPRPK
jgi:hypothetical protein